MNNCVEQNVLWKKHFCLLVSTFHYDVDPPSANCIVGVSCFKKPNIFIIIKQTIIKNFGPIVEIDGKQKVAAEKKENKEGSTGRVYSKNHSFPFKFEALKNIWSVSTKPENFVFCFFFLLFILWYHFVRGGVDSTWHKEMHFSQTARPSHRSMYCLGEPTITRATNHAHFVDMQRKNPFLVQLSDMALLANVVLGFVKRTATCFLKDVFFSPRAVS